MKQTWRGFLIPRQFLVIFFSFPEAVAIPERIIIRQESIWTHLTNIWLGRMFYILIINGSFTYGLIRIYFSKLINIRENPYDSADWKRKICKWGQAFDRSNNQSIELRLDTVEKLGQDVDRRMQSSQSTACNRRYVESHSHPALISMIPRNTIYLILRWEVVTFET